MQELNEPRPKRGRPRIFADRRLTNAECVARWRAKHPKPPKPKPEEPEEGFLRLKTFSELAAAAGLVPEQKPQERRPGFDVEALIG
jgi:hypothetical protein